VDDPTMLDGPPILALPSPRKKGHGHDADPYETLPGAVVMHQTTVKPLARKPTKEDAVSRAAAQHDMKVRAERHTRYLDALVEFAGDQEQALADVYGLTVEQVRPQRLELLADVRTGIGSTDLGEILERNALDLTARVNLLRRHAYSNTPAASLKALDMIADLDDDRSDHGSFESYLRMVKSQKG
jgi:hypothetical protein